MNIKFCLEKAPKVRSHIDRRDGDYVEYIEYGRRHFSVKTRNSETHFIGRNAKKRALYDLVARLDGTKK